MSAQIAWPVVVLSHDDSFLHVADSPAALREHVVSDLRTFGPAPARVHDSASELGFFDCEGFHLMPRLGRRWLLVALDRTPERTTPAMLVRRMAVAALTAQERWTARLVRTAVADGVPPEVAQLTVKTEAPHAPMPQGRGLREYAQLILAEDEWLHDQMHGGNSGPGWDD